LTAESKMLLYFPKIYCRYKTETLRFAQSDRKAAFLEQAKDLITFERDTKFLYF